MTQLPKLTVTDGTSSSVMVTVASSGVPALTPSGSVAPKLSLTLSPSSSTVSVSAVNVKDSEVSPLSKVTFCGTPE